MQLRVVVEGFKEVQKEFAELDATQVPYASAVALTKTAQQGQAKVQESLPVRFTIRRLAWAKGGVRIQPAKKTLLEARVQDINPYMERQETGADKLPKHGRFVAVPLSGVRGWYSRKLIAPEDMPDKVMEQGGFIRGSIMYRVTFKQGRRGRLSKAVGGMQKAAKWSRKIVPMYALVRKAKMRARYDFRPTVEAVVQKNFRANFAEAFAKARASKKG